MVQAWSSRNICVRQVWAVIVRQHEGHPDSSTSPSRWMGRPNDSIEIWYCIVRTQTELAERLPLVLHKQLADLKRTGRRGLGCAACKLAANNQVDQRYVPLACWRDDLLQRHNNFFAPRIDHHAASAETDTPRGSHRVGVNFGRRYGVSFETTTMA